MAKWVTNWGVDEAPATVREQSYAKDITLRYVVPVALDGSKIRLTFSNRYSDEIAKMAMVTVGRTTYKSSVTTQICPLTFGGKTEGVISARQTLTSDELPFAVKKGELLNVSIYLKDLTKLTTGITIIGGYSYGFLCGGNYADKTEFPTYTERDSASHFLLCGMDVFADRDDAYAIVCFGDSITAQSWPDQVTERLLDPNGGAFDKQIAIVRKAISGSRVLREYQNWLNVHYGEAGVHRIERDLDMVSGAKALMFMHGVNDLIHPGGHPIYRPNSDLPTPSQLQEGLQVYIGAARKRGLAVYASPITPFGKWHSYTPARNEIRLAVNEWIRTTDRIDKVVDFARLTQDPSSADLMKLDGTDDGLHPSYATAGEMAKLFFESVIVNEKE